MGRVGHDVLMLGEDQQSVQVFVEQENLLKLNHGFYFPFSEFLGVSARALRLAQDRVDKVHALDVFLVKAVPSSTSPGALDSSIENNMLAYYRTYKPSNRILLNFDLPPEKIKLYEDFLHEWHHLENPVTIIHPTTGHEAALIRYATVAATQELSKRATLGSALKKLLKLDKEPKAIDCFDISHKQGHYMVGSCVRFTDGQPDKKFFRHFHIKTVKDQNDYACLAEIIARRYRDGKDLPDLIVIDGGKGQLSAVRDLIPAGVQVISLAKREETVFSANLPAGKKLDKMSITGQMLIALRDYTHHFAISFHRKIAREDLN